MRPSRGATRYHFHGCRRDGGNHLGLANPQGGQQRTRGEQDLPEAAALLRDVDERSTTAMLQAHTFLATELALQAHGLASRPE